MIRFVEHRIGDRRIVRLIQKWLKAGVLEQGRWIETKEGTPQGAVISPILANLYLHYVLDLLGSSMASEEGAGRSDRRSLRRRCRARIPVPGRSHAVSCRTEG